MCVAIWSVSGSPCSLVVRESGVQTSKKVPWVGNLVHRRCPATCTHSSILIFFSWSLLNAEMDLSTSPRHAAPNPPPSSSMLCNARQLHALGEVFSMVVESMSEVGRREEECRLVERETEKMLSRQGGNVRLQVSS